MRLTDIPGVMLNDLWGTWRRRLVAGAVVLVCCVVVLAESLSAARVALTPSFGALGARLVLAGAFSLMMAAVVGWLRHREGRESAARAADERPFGGDQKVTVIAEAIHLGYMIARDLRDWRAKASNEDCEDAAEASAKSAPAASVRDRS
jgi:hypothetical protein